eukprot:14432330-Alexandrium_andersonii.AAC.1
MPLPQPAQPPRVPERVKSARELNGSLRARANEVTIHGHPCQGTEPHESKMRSMARKRREACQRSSLASPSGSPRHWRMRSARAAA